MLRGQVALITGASKGVGEAIAVAYAGEGATLCLAARSADALAETAERCRAAGGPAVSIHPTDLSQPAEVDRLAAEVLHQHGGRVDVLVNSAGAYPGSGQIDPLEGDADAWEAALALNVQAPMRLTRRLAPGMAQRGRGCVISLGSVAGRKGVADEGAYAASKWALRGWSNACYEELRSAGIKVVLLQPSHVATDMAAAQEGTRYARMEPGLMIQAEDVAEAALLPFRLSLAAVPAEIVLNRMQTPYEAE